MNVVCQTWTYNEKCTYYYLTHWENVEIFASAMDFEDWLFLAYWKWVLALNNEAYSLCQRLVTGISWPSNLPIGPFTVFCEQCATNVR